MKNLKKVLALVVALTMVLGTVGFAAYTDVAEDANEYTAVSTLSSLSILTGYEDGSFKPDGDITRAEFATVVCRALGAKVSGSAVTGFTDVPADHWASAYIAYCAGAGIVNGMGDGTFAPSANVTVEQAVKMLVVALGYEPMAAAKGGYPTGYMVVANTNGITEGVGGQTAAATRADVAKLVYNALDVPMMVQDGFGTQVSFKVADGGENNPAYQSLLTGLEVAKLEGAVTATSIIPNGDGDKAEVGSVKYEYTEANDDKYFTEKLGKSESFEMDFAVAEGVNADAYFQNSSIIYVREISRNKYEIIAIMAGEENEVLEIGIEDVDLEASSDAVIKYFTDASRYDTDSIKADKKVAWYLNYKSVGSYSASIGKYKDSTADVEIAIIDNDDNNKFDAVIVKAYSYKRVKNVEADRDRFTTTDSTSFTFDFEDDTKTVSIVDKNGEAMELADFAENDVIAYISAGEKTKKADWIEIINLGQNAVTGQVDGIIETNDKKEALVVTVDGTEYDLTKEGLANLQDEGTFYLTRTGKIFNVEISDSVAGNYGYILATDKNDAGWDLAWQIKMLTKDNEIVTYTVADTFKIDGIDYKKADSSALLEKFDIDSAGTDAFGKFVKERIVTYQTNPKGYIKEIKSVEASAFGQPDVDSAAGEEFDADLLYMAKKDFEEDTVIFNISASTENGVFATTIDTLVHENEYKGYYVENKAKSPSEFDCLVITYGGSMIDVTQPLAIISSVSDTKVNEEDALKVKYFTAAEDTERTITIFKENDLSSAEWGTKIDNISVGDAMMFTDDGNGTAVAYAIVVNATATSDGLPVINSAAQAKIFAESDEDIEIVEGYYYATTEANNGTGIRSLTIADSTKEADRIIINGATNNYTVVNAKGSKYVRVYSDEWDAVEDVDSASVDDDKANYFFAVKNRNSITDFVMFSHRYNVTVNDMK